ncbi:MAG: outer membrane protein assembly factor BamD [Myxococcota bacterium]|nr:outer membrane protein assembly factor BamD [Myxococcota bacterium]
MNVLVRVILASSLLVSLSFGARGCASSGMLGKLKPGSAEYLYQSGLLDLEDGLFPEAIKSFSIIKSKFPYSVLARLADLRISDTYFAQGKYSDAIGSYRRFLKYNPDHREAPYALFQIGESHFERVPGDWWFLPPAAEKDQGKVKLAISAYQDLLAQYKTGPYADLGRERLRICRRKLADHELYVANFYFERDHFKAAAGRAEQLLSDYPGLGLERSALWIAARSRIASDEPALAKTWLERLIGEFPNTEEGKAAVKKLERLPAAAAPESP